MENIKKKIILITGGANGIGKSITKKLDINSNVIIVIDNDIDACKLLKKKNPSIVYYIEDVTNFTGIEKIINEIFDRYENIDILINNVGIQTISKICELNIEDWKRVMDVNLTANFYLTQMVSNKMKENSTILNITSTHYNSPRTDHAHYDISKCGIVYLTKLFAIELAKKSVTINALAIGATYSRMNQVFEYDKQSEEIAKNKIPMKHICTSDEISDYVYNIIKDFSYNTTGSVFTIDGGRSLV